MMSEFRCSKEEEVQGNDFCGSLQKYGRIDILISNAAVNPSVDPILTMSEKALDKLWEINLKASVQIVQVN
jgi:NAD(P)-dependent dehydrogenase (short-subunit alcohol dehydrogenase family)